MLPAGIFKITILHSLADPSSYYKEVYYRQFQAEPAAQPGCTQPYSSQTQTCGSQRDDNTSLVLMPDFFNTEVRSESLLY